MWWHRSRRNLHAELNELERRAGARHDNADQRADRDRAEAGLIRHLVDATLRLEGLTRWLIVLTIVLALLTAVLTIGEADRVLKNGFRILEVFGQLVGR